MALRHLLLRFTPRLDGRWIVAGVVVLVLVLAGTFIRWTGPVAPLDLVALGPEGSFADTVAIPAQWADSATTAPDAVIRVPLILGVRNLGRSPVRPESLSLSLPLRYRLTAEGGGDLSGQVDPGSPLITYTLRPELPPIEPERLPMMLPAHDTLWLEVLVPSYYCVAVADSIPEFVPAPPPPVEAMGQIRLFYAFEGGDLDERRTGTLSVRIDTTLLRVELPESPAEYEMVNDPELAQPELGALQRVGSVQSSCGEPESPMQLLSTVWETENGGRLITLDYGGTVRKHLFDLDGDSIIERESWAPDGREFTATRRTELPIPAFLLPGSESGRYDLARFDTLPADSVARLDPFRRAMSGPGELPGAAAGPGADSVREARVEAQAADGEGEPEEESEPQPAPRQQGPLGVPIDPDGRE